MESYDFFVTYHLINIFRVHIIDLLFEILRCQNEILMLCHYISSIFFDL